ncbi:unnamed protein product [Microthlaspi erraticum]|uniref:TF-B3 domain-containing protein n=1 Tax=Microthlaspi erraticum TaxID=1685480 RepID=A0A6D2IVG1_9BRAS|nr:unnamed protein product [Microthlaspi erraticum]
MASSITTILTPEDELAARILLQLSQEYRQQPREREAIAEAELHSTPLLQQVSKAPKKPSSKKRKRAKEENDSEAKTKEEDDSEETLTLMQEWHQTELDPGEIYPGVAEGFSEPIKKHLKESDVKNDQNRLMLVKHQVEQRMFPMLQESEIPRGKNWLDVKVYGPDGKVHDMTFKMWNKENTPVLTTGWNEFVDKCDLKMNCDFLTIWMFRHMVTRKICFAIHCTRLPINNPPSRRILREAFLNQN